MINANELRIGNYVISDEAGLTTVNGNLIQFLTTPKSLITGFVEPVPLTEDRLLQLGFRRLDKYTFAYKGFFIHMRKRGFVYSGKLIVETVHHLQNLFFALKGEELKQLNNL